MNNLRDQIEELVREQVKETFSRLLSSELRNENAIIEEITSNLGWRLEELFDDGN
jgi:hypothetical protein